MCAFCDAASVDWERFLINCRDANKIIRHARTEDTCDQACDNLSGALRMLSIFKKFQLKIFALVQAKFFLQDLWSQFEAQFETLKYQKNCSKKSAQRNFLSRIKSFFVIWGRRNQFFIIQIKLMMLCVFKVALWFRLIAGCSPGGFVFSWLGLERTIN